MPRQAGFVPSDGFILAVILIDHNPEEANVILRDHLFMNDFSFMVRLSRLAVDSSCFGHHVCQNVSHLAATDPDLLGRRHTWCRLVCLYDVYVN